MQGKNCNNTTYTTSRPDEFNQSILIQIRSTLGAVYLINFKINLDPIQ